MKKNWSPGENTPVYCNDTKVNIDVKRINELFHKLWGKAHDGPDKKEWTELQSLLEKNLSK
jgi:hypothetical protein